MEKPLIAYILIKGKAKHNNNITTHFNLLYSFIAYGVNTG